jgi:hypothetical protein
LEELAAVFGDVDEVKLYSRELTMDANGEVTREDHHEPEEKKHTSGVVLREDI